jgi:hypothetical protein
VLKNQTKFAGAHGRVGPCMWLRLVYVDTVVMVACCRPGARSSTCVLSSAELSYVIDSRSIKASPHDPYTIISPGRWQLAASGKRKTKLNMLNLF